MVIKTNEAGQRTEKKEIDTKTRHKMDEDELREHIFNCFGRQSFWKLKELNGELHQPEPHLKGVLDKLCIHHRKGEHKTMYELRPEFKSSAAPLDDEL